MGGSPKRGGSNGGGMVMSRGRVILVAVLALQLVLVVCFVKAPRLVWSSNESVDALDEGAPAVSRSFWLWRLISSTAPNCTDGDGHVITEAVKGSSIKCGDRSSLLRMKWIEPKREAQEIGTHAKAEVASGAVLRKVNATTVFRNSHGVNARGREGRAGLREGRAGLREGRAGLREGREGLREGRAGLREGRAGLREGRAGLREGRAGLREGRAGLREGRARLEKAGGNARSGSNVAGDLRQRRVQVGRDLPATVDVDMARDSEAAIETKSASWHLQREFAANIRSSLERDMLRSRGRTVGYGDQRPSNGSGDLRVAHNASASIASIHASVAPFARIEANASAGIAPIAANVSDSAAPVARSQPSALLFNDNQRPGEEEPEEDELEEADPDDVTIASSDGGVGGRREALPPFNASSGSNTSLAEISPRNVSLNASTRNASLEVSLNIPVRNGSLEISPRNTTLIPTLDSAKRNSTRSEDLEQVASARTTPSAAQNATVGNATAATASSSSNATCPQGLIYVYNLPKKFNTELLENCSQLLAWGDGCQELSNAGLGPALGASPLPKQGNSSSGPWYGTDQFKGEVIFHHRILTHPCRTHNLELAKAFYIPYYGGLDVERFLFNITNKDFTSADRDKLGTELVAWLSRSPYWKRHQGLDHFLFLGRITWDFRRSGRHGWGSGLLHMAEMANMTKLTLERSPWDNSEMAVPYPTAFHPRNDSEVVAWQQALRATRRDLLFSFAGQKRPEYMNDFWVALLEQCAKAEERCAVLDCSQRKCEDDALAATKLFVRSTFCLQPRGDSFTQRSIFDALIAGCIPVFFWTKSAYLQYQWHLPSDHGSYSVFIPKQDLLRKGVRIEDVLSQIPPAKVQQMQETVIDLIPRLVYAQGQVQFRDAFDTSIDMAMAALQLRLQHQRNATHAAAPAPAPPAMNPKPELAGQGRAFG